MSLEIEKLVAENQRLKKQVSKKEKWIEKDEKLAKKQRVGRLVTRNDLDDPAFIKKYPRAKIGDEFNDPEPLFWKLGLKRPPTIEEQHAKVAAQFARDFKDELEQGYSEEFLDDFDDFDDNPFTHAELQAFVHEASLEDKIQTSLPAKQSAANGVEDTAKPSAPSSDSSQSEE